MVDAQFGELKRKSDNVELRSNDIYGLDFCLMKKA